MQGANLRQRDDVSKVREVDGSSAYSDGFIIQRVVEKYMDHLPLERQVRILAREGWR